MPATMLYNFGAALLRSVGDTRRPLVYLTIAGIVNVLLNLVLVIAFHMDVAGVAIATVASQVLSAALVVRCLMQAEGCFRLELTSLRLHPARVKQIVRIGIPAGMQSALFSISNVLIQSSINSFGSTVMAGNSAAGNIEGFVYVGMNCFSQTCMTFTSQNLGAGKLKRIDPILYTCCACLTIIGLVLGFGARFFAEPLLGIYTTDPEVIAMGVVRMTYICLPYFLCGLMDTMAGHLRGLGSGVPPMIISLAGACGLRILWIYTVFAADPTLGTLYLSYPISWGVTALVHFIYSRFLKKQILRKYGSDN
jgi:putative MATE family efflux protein